MFDSLDVLIGLITVYLTLAFACTAMVEALAASFKTRGKILEKGLREFLAGDLTEGKPFVDEFYKHPLVWSLSRGKDGLPSYIPPKIVGQVVEALVMANGAVTRPKEAADDPPLDAVHSPPLDTAEEVYVKGLFGGLLRNVIGEAAVLRAEGSARSLYEGIENLPGGSENQVKGVLRALLRRAEGDPVRFRAAVEEHFNLVMDRASGWFKRHQQLVALLVSAVFVGVGNVDTFSIATSLSQDKNKSMRENMISYAEEILKKDDSKLAEKAPIVSDHPVEDALGKYAEALSALNQVGGLQFGWTSRDIQGRDMSPSADSATTVDRRTVGDTKVADTPVPKEWRWFEKAIGLLITTFAVSLGAPFWFDLLKRFMQVREAGKPPCKPAEPDVCKPEL